MPEEPSTAATELNPSPRAVLRERVAALLAKAESRWKKLPPVAQLSAFGAFIFLTGLLLGAIISRPSAAPTPAAELAAFAKGVSAPESAVARDALERGDLISAYAVFKTPAAYDHLRADARAQALRSRLALLNHEPADALDWLEQALGTESKLSKQSWAAPAVVQTFGANKPGRTTALLGRLPKDAAHDALIQGCGDWQYRVRHGAFDALKANGDACPDAVGFLVLDAWELDRCDTARPVVKQLGTYVSSDPRVPAVLDAISRRDSLKGCVADLLPKAQK